MTAGAGALKVEDALLEPPALPAPPTRHSLFIILIVLAALLHVATIGSGDLYSQTEGQYAGGAKEMLDSHEWLLPTNDGILRLQKPPLLYWLIILSFKFFGVNAAAARLPVALAVVVSVALIFLIGERLTNYWRGFVAGMIYLSFCGTFLLARIVMPEPLVTAFIAAAILCGICGYQRRQHRPAWFAGFWICAGLACLSKGLLGIAYPAAILVLLCIFYREARIRFRALLRWHYLFIFCLIVAPWHLWVQWHFPGYFHYLVTSEWLGHLRGLDDTMHDFKGVPVSQFLLMHVGWWFPWSIALLPGVIFAWRHIIRPKEIDFSDAVPLCWMAIIFVPLLFLGQRQDYYSMSMWSALALWAAVAWDRMPRGWRGVGAVAVGLIGIITLILASLLSLRADTLNGHWGPMDERWTAWKALHDMPVSAWLMLRPMLVIAGCSLVCLSAIALYLIIKQREKLAAIVLASAMLPIGLVMIGDVARTGPYFSLAELGRFLNTRLDENDEALFEGPLDDGSSLVLYLNRKFLMVNQNRQKEAPFGELAFEVFLNENAVLEKWDGSNAVYLIVEQARVNHWKQVLTARFHIYHQVTVSGTYAVLSNQL